MNKILSKITWLLIVLCMVSCAPSEERFLSRFESFVNDVCESSSQLTSADWEAIDMEYNSYMEEYNYQYMSTFTPEENRQFGRLQARYVKAIMKVSMSMSGEYIDAGSQVLNGYMEEMGSDLDEMGIDDYVNGVYKDAESLEVEEFVENVEDQLNDMDFDF